MSDLRKERKERKERKKGSKMVGFCKYKALASASWQVHPENHPWQLALLLRWVISQTIATHSSLLKNSSLFPS